MQTLRNFENSTGATVTIPANSGYFMVDALNIPYDRPFMGNLDVTTSGELLMCFYAYTGTKAAITGTATPIYTPSNSLEYSGTSPSWAVQSNTFNINITNSTAPATDFYWTTNDVLHATNHVQLTVPTSATTNIVYPNSLSNDNWADWNTKWYTTLQIRNSDTKARTVSLYVNAFGIYGPGTAVKSSYVTTPDGTIKYSIFDSSFAGKPNDQTAPFTAWAQANDRTGTFKIYDVSIPANSTKTLTYNSILGGNSVGGLTHHAIVNN